MMIDRRAALAAVFVAAGLRPLVAQGKPLVMVHKDPSCGCCGAWAEHIGAAGYPTRIVEDARINAVKARLGVPQPLWSCHTAEVEGFVLEGHVPAEALARLLAERPAIRGLAVPGMPVGSPGMEVPGTDPDTYDVMAFGRGEPTTFMRFRGGVMLPA